MIRKYLTTSVFLALMHFIALATEVRSFNETLLFDPAFENIAIEQGLSNLNISSICQDSLGYLWIGTARGLNRYDGSTFKQFFFSPEGNTPGIPYDFIEATIYCQNHIFVNTRLGVAAYNLKSEVWHHISGGLPVSDMIEVGNRAFFIKQDSLFEYNFTENILEKCDFFEQVRPSFFIPSDDGYLWVLSEDCQIVNRYDFESHEIKATPLDDMVLIRAAFHKIIENRLFLSSESGLRILEISADGLIQNSHSRLFSEFKESSVLSFFLSVERWDKNRVLICSFEQGLHLYNLSSGALRKITKEEAGLRTELLKKLFIDRDGNLWAGSFDKGLEVYYKKQNAFNFDRHLNALAHEEFVNTIAWNDFQEDLVFGTRTKGVVSNKYGANTLVNDYLKSSGIINVISLYLDSEQKMWIGGYDKLLIYDQKSNRLANPEDYLNLKHIQHISEKDGFIYLVTHNGFYVYSLDGHLIKQVLESVFGGNQILHSRDKSFFCSELNGLFAYDRNSGIAEQVILHKDGSPFYWQGAVCMKEESDSIWWIGTLSWGLIRVNLTTLECKSYTVEDGLPGNDVTAIERDKQGRLWLSTSDGISCMYAPGLFNNFSPHEGIGNSQFHRRSSLSDKSGIIYFGGNNGLTYFNPSEIKLNEKFNKKTYFQELIVNGFRINVGDESGILDKTLPFSDKLVFTHRVTSFSVDYSAIDFYAHDQILYSHMLEGWDTRWQFPNNLQGVNYSNLPPGTYALLVKAKRSSGEWSEPSSLGITIKPAPWKTWWAYTAYIMVFIFTVFLIFSMRFRNQMIASNLEIEHRERSRESEITEMKLRFFTNISHEFRTPLSVINSVAFLLSKNVEFEGYAKDLFNSLNLNVDRLIRLINQLLTFRELESDTLSLSIHPERIDKILEHTCSSLSIHADVKKITLINSYSSSVREIHCDADKVEKILSNLISNAIKYTPEGGQIAVKSKILSKVDALSQYGKLKKRPFPISESGYLEITVKDNGRGIRKNDLETIFKRYSKTASFSKKEDYSSSGIGLNFVKRLVIVHHGDIRVDSIYKKGSEFSFILPLDGDIYREEQRLSLKVKNSENQMNLPVSPLQATQMESEKSNPAPKYKIAVVEDDLDLCSVLVNTFSSQYSVCYAHDGQSGLGIIRKERPDLVISDIMMPGMDGIALCEEIKRDESLNHIIVILLSAKSEISDQIKGISRGADLYIPKPFSLDYLLTVISSQIRIRDKIHNTYLRGKSPELNETEANQEVIHFLSRFNSLLEKEVSNVDLSVDLLSEKMNMGRSSFYKKFTTITNTSPNVYVAKYRLNKSLELLHEQRYSISEVSDLTGFRNASYFSTIFKKEKGITPREYIKKLKEEGVSRPSSN